MRKEISNTDDIIDSRDVIARIEELESELSDLRSDVDDAREARDSAEGEEARDEAQEELDDAESALSDWEGADELKALKALAEEGEGSPGWPYGEALIRDSHFEDYAQQLAEDIGAVDRELGWPYTCIEWERAARELQMDYFSVDFDGETYWIRG